MNEYIATLVDELYQLGVRHVVCSPGSRSTTMAMLFKAYEQFSVYMNIDERSAAFMALGIAKATHEPAVLVCTSGSALTHYGPAAVEAKHAGVPLIILSADRPPTLQNVGAPQTIDQQKYFGTAVNYYEELSVPSDESYYFTYPRKVAQRAYMKSMDHKKGPVHINVPLFEPLVPSMDPELFTKGRRPFRIAYDVMDELIDKKILVLAGPSVRYPASVMSFGEEWSAPIIADPLSNLRQYEDVISTYDAVLANHDLWDELKPDVVIQLGQIPVSKRIQQWMATLDDIEYIEVGPTMDYLNPSLTSTIHVPLRIEEFLVNHSQLEGSSDSDYLDRWQLLEVGARDQLDRVKDEPQLFEGRTIYMLQHMIQKGQLVVANSMTIRDMDYFWASGRSETTVYGNRGTNGIDGTISTALGISANGLPTVLLTGDLSFFHDLNGFAIGKTHHLNLTIILHNNDGGGIFQYLPQHGTAYFDYLFNTPQGINYEGLQDLYGIDYVKVSNNEELQAAMTAYIGKSGIHVIEVPTTKEGSRALHKEYRVK